MPVVPQNHRSTSTRGVAALAAVLAGALAIAAPAHAGERLTATLERASVTFHVPATVARGDSPVIALRVRPAGDAAPPVRVRARVGMPHHGRWLTGEAAHAWSEGALAFRGQRCPDPPNEPGVLCIGEHDVLIPKFGRYRLRVWIDYPDGHVEKTGIDIDVAPGEPAKARVMR